MVDGRVEVDRRQKVQRYSKQGLVYGTSKDASLMHSTPKAKALHAALARHGSSDKFQSEQAMQLNLADMTGLRP